MKYEAVPIMKNKIYLCPVEKDTDTEDIDFKDEIIFYLYKKNRKSTGTIKIQR